MSIYQYVYVQACEVAVSSVSVYSIIIIEIRIFIYSNIIVFIYEIKY